MLMIRKNLMRINNLCKRSSRYQPPMPLFPWFVPQTRPQPEPTPEVTSVFPMITLVPTNPPATTPPQPTSIPDEILDYDHRQEERLGISNVVQEREQSSSSYSREENAPGISEAGCEASVQAVLPGIEEAQDDYGHRWLG